MPVIYGDVLGEANGLTVVKNMNTVFEVCEDCGAILISVVGKNQIQYQLKKINQSIGVM